MKQFLWEHELNTKDYESFQGEKYANCTNPSNK